MEPEKRSMYVSYVHTVNWFLTKAIQWRKKEITNGAGTIRYSHAKKNNLNPYFVSYMKINSKWSINPRTIKLLEEDIEEIFFDLGPGKDFLDTTQKAIYMKRK